MSRHPSLDITDEQEANLRKLAAYLWTLPADYPDFEMDLFSRDGRGHCNDRAHVPVCGTSACAVGHGPVAGIKPLPDENWFSYAKRAFFGRTNALFTWCADEDWSKTDNTVHGAAARIEWALANGIPDDADEQRLGDEPLCYAQGISTGTAKTPQAAEGEACEPGTGTACAQGPSA